MIRQHFIACTSGVVLLPSGFVDTFPDGNVSSGVEEPLTIVDEVEATTEPPKSVETPLKRKRGRPPKRKGPVASQSALAATESEVTAAPAPSTSTTAGELLLTTVVYIV